MDFKNTVLKETYIKIVSGILFLALVFLFFPGIVRYAYRISVGASPLAIIVKTIYVLFFAGLAINLYQIFYIKKEFIAVEKLKRNASEKGSAPENFLLGVGESIIRERFENILQIKKYDVFINHSELSDISSSKQGLKDDLPKYFALILPIIGLIGTLIGLTLSVGGLETVVSALSEVTQLREGMKTTMEGMGTAFDTTLMGAVGMIILRYFNMITSHARSSLMLEISEIIEVKVLPRMALCQDKSEIEQTDIKVVLLELIKSFKILSETNNKILKELKETLPFELNLKTKKSILER